MDLTPLQQAACERIGYFDGELRKRRLTPRLAVEQEFILSRAIDALPPDEGMLLGHERPNERKKYSDYEPVLQKLGQFASLHELEQEMTTSPRNERDRPLWVYEAKFDTHHRKSTPLDMVHDVMRFRAQAQDIFRDASMKPLFREIFRDSEPCVRFDAIPYPGDPEHSHETMGMHMSMSVYDRDGYDLCNSTAFSRMFLAESLLRLQDYAGLAFMQDEANVRRHKISRSTPKHVEMGRTDHAKSKGTSITERQGLHSYIENRMLAADADAYVAGALQMAALHTAVSQLEIHPFMQDCDITCSSIRRQFQREERRELKPKHTACFENNLQGWAQRYTEHGNELSYMLGDELFEAIRDTYSRMPAAARYAR